MGRLIDADKFKKYLRRYLHYGHAIPWVDAQPTAYDPDKVVEQLKKKAISVLDEDEPKEDYEIEVVILPDAIEIVKGGGAE